MARVILLRRAKSIFYCNIQWVLRRAARRRGRNFRDSARRRGAKCQAFTNFGAWGLAVNTGKNIELGKQPADAARCEQRYSREVSRSGGQKRGKNAHAVAQRMVGAALLVENGGSNLDYDRLGSHLGTNNERRTIPTAHLGPPDQLAIDADAILAEPV